MLDTYGKILLFCISLSFLLLKWNNVLMGGLTLLLWIGFSVFALQNPPTSIVNGSFTHLVLVYVPAGVGMAIAFTHMNRRSYYQNMGISDLTNDKQNNSKEEDEDKTIGYRQTNTAHTNNAAAYEERLDHILHSRRRR